MGKDSGVWMGMSCGTRIAGGDPLALPQEDQIQVMIIGIRLGIHPRILMVAEPSRIGLGAMMLRLKP